MTPGQSTQLSGVQHGGVFLGMLTVGIACTGLRLGSLRAWVMGGCVLSALALGFIAWLGLVGMDLMRPATFALGFGNGVFAVAAIGAMMALAGQGRQAREGTRMGLWGAAQALAAGFGGLLGAASADALRLVMADAPAFATVFLAEAFLFLVAALMAAQVVAGGAQRAQSQAVMAGE